MPEPLHFLPYYGGKSSKSPTRLNQWILSLLPPFRYNVHYIEPFAGMLGVLLSRPKASVETANDTSENLICLWRALRDQPGELYHLLEHTPHSEAEFHRARRELKASVGLDKALNVAILMCMDLTFSADAKSGLRVSYATGNNTSIMRRFSPDFWDRLWKRVQNVQFLCRDAIDLLARVQDIENTVIYCDPPYTGQSTVRNYGKNTLDPERLKSVLKDIKGQVAISGYGDTYDDLGWHRHEKKIKIRPYYHRKSNVQSNNRTEVLWTNYDPARFRPTLFT